MFSSKNTTMIRQHSDLLPSFQFINHERLSLAICLAKRDVAKLCSVQTGSNTTPIQYSEFDEQMLSEYTHRWSQVPQLQNDNHTSISQHQSSLEHPTSKPVQKHNPRNRLVQLPKSSNMEQKPTAPSPLPARSDSPPTRDSDGWIPSKPRPPLHAPTEKQLKSAQESQLRQLQNKVARYSAALAEIRGATLEQTKPAVTNPSGLAVRQKSKRSKLINIPTHRSRKASSHSSSSLIRPRPLPLRHRTGDQFTEGRSVRRTFSSHSPQMRPPTASNFSSQRGTDSSIRLLWEQALGTISSECSDFVILQPEKSAYSDSSAVIPCSRCAPLQQTQPDSRQNQPIHNPVDENINEAFKNLLNEINVAEAEEENIRRRWTNLNLADSGVSAIGQRYTQVPTTVINSEQAEFMRRWETMEKINSNDMAGTSEPKPFGDSPILFTKPAQPTQISKLNQDLKSESFKQMKSQDSSQHKVLRLPVQLHRGLLVSSSNKAQLQEEYWINYGGLAVDPFGTIPLVGACEQLAKLLVDQSLDQALDLIEQATNDLVEELIKGEMFTEAPDSTHSIDWSTDQFQAQIWESLDSKICQFEIHHLTPSILDIEHDRIESGSMTEQSESTKSLPQGILQVSPETIKNETAEENQYTSEFEPISESYRSETGVLTANLNIEQMSDNISDSDSYNDLGT